MDIIWLIIMIVFLAVIGGVVDMVIPGRMPNGWIGGVVAGIAGGLLGGFLFGNFGPAITAFGWTLSIIPALLGAIIFAVIVRFVLGMSGRKTI